MATLGYMIEYDLELSSANDPRGTIAPSADSHGKQRCDFSFLSV